MTHPPHHRRGWEVDFAAVSVSVSASVAVSASVSASVAVAVAVADEDMYAWVGWVFIRFSSPLGEEEKRMNTRHPHTKHDLTHHGLRVWHKAVELCKLVHRHPIRDAELRRHASEAAKSVALNIGEGAGQQGGAQGRHFKIAKGSVIEVVAAYEIADAIGENVPVAAVCELGNNIAAMLAGLIGPRRR